MNDLSNLHTFGLAANCQRLLILESADDLTALTESINNQQPLIILGSGSNCIFTENWEGLVALNRLKGIHVNERSDRYELRVASGENWHELVTFCLQQQIFGFENLALIPGTVGAAPIQNIGAYGRELTEFVSGVEYIDLETGTRNIVNNQECKFGYRNSVFKHPIAKHWFISQVHFVLPKANRLETSYGELAQLSQPSPHRIFDKVCEVRRRKLPDPALLGNAGSFFKNPVISLESFASLQLQFEHAPYYKTENGDIKIPAAWLIDQCGFKGRALGGVRCHPNQPLVLTNIGGATGEELLTLARNIRDAVRDKFKIELINEVRILGPRGLITL